MRLCRSYTFHTVSMAHLVLVKWLEKGKYEGLEQAIEKKYIKKKDVKEGDTVEVRWGKSGRLWKGVYLGEYSEKTEQKRKKGGKQDKPNKKKKYKEVSTRIMHF